MAVLLQSIIESLRILRLNFWKWVIWSSGLPDIGATYLGSPGTSWFWQLVQALCWRNPLKVEALLINEYGDICFRGENKKNTCSYLSALGKILSNWVFLGIFTFPFLIESFGYQDFSFGFSVLLMGARITNIFIYVFFFNFCKFMHLPHRPKFEILFPEN